MSAINATNDADAAPAHERFPDRRRRRLGRLGRWLVRLVVLGSLGFGLVFAVNTLGWFDLSVELDSLESRRLEHAALQQALELSLEESANAPSAVPQPPPGEAAPAPAPVFAPTDAQGAGALQIPAPVAVEIMEPLFFERYFGRHRYRLFGAVLGREIRIKAIGEASLTIGERPVDGHRFFITRLELGVADPPVAALSFRKITLISVARREGEDFTPVTYEHRLEYLAPWKATELRKLRYHLDEGYLVETAPAKNQRVETHGDCWDPVTILLKAINLPWPSILALDPDGDGKVQFSHIYVEGEEEAQFAAIDRRQRTFSVMFSERAFPGGGTARLRYRADPAGDQGFVLDPVELEYGSVVSGFLRLRTP